jgi:hypothetical protein
LIPFEKVADLLKEVLPVGESTNHETVREHLQGIAKHDSLAQARFISTLFGVAIY